jgi:hypothetical protein
MTPKSAQINFENSLQNGQVVVARWTHKGARYQAKAQVLDHRDASIAVIITEGGHPIEGTGPAFPRGSELSIPRRENRTWSIHNCVYLATPDRPCARPGCKHRIHHEGPERKKYCSDACRLAAHRERASKGQDIASLIDRVSAEVRRVGDLALSRRWGALRRRLAGDR